MPARILFDARALVEQSGGVSRVAERLLEHIKQTRPTAEITLVTTGIKKPTLAHTPHVHIYIPNKLWSILCLLRITSLDRFTNMRTGIPFDELVLPNIGFIGTPIIHTTLVVHDLSFLIEPRWFPWKMRLWHHAVRATTLIRNAQQLFCVSQTTANDVMRLLSVEQDRVMVLSPRLMIGIKNDIVDPVGAQLSRAHPETVATSTGAAELRPYRTPIPYVLAFEDTARKNIATAIAAVARLREDDHFNDLRLVIIENSKLEMRNTELSWIDRKSHVTDAELQYLYRHASALLYPSWYEGFGLPPHEAAQYGIPCIASSHGAIPETAPPETILVPPSKPHLWASALRSALLLRST